MYSGIYRLGVIGSMSVSKTVGRGSTPLACATKENKCLDEV